MSYLLHIVIFFPLFGAFALCMLKGENSRIFAVLVSALELLFVLLLWGGFNIHYGGFQFMSDIPIIHTLGIGYTVGIDGISLTLITLNAILTLLALGLFKYITTSTSVAILFLEGILMGVFSALDVLLFYIFWEFSLLPILYMLGILGGNNRIYASIKYFIYAFGGSIIMLLGILYFAYQYSLIVGIWSFNLLDWYQISFDLQVQKWLFVAFFIGMAVKIPLFPLHSWQPHTYTQAPIIASALLAGIVSKMGTYALLRLLLPLFPDMSHIAQMTIGIICVFMVIYGAMLCLVQKDIKTLLAYSSFSHMGIMVLGIFSLNPLGLSGAVFFMLSHGLIIAALFFIVGMLYDRIRTQQISQMQGLAHSLPHLSTAFGIVMMASLGLPLTVGFVGEVLCLYGFFTMNPLIAFLAGSSFFVGAIYMLNVFRKVFFGMPLSQNAILRDVNAREKLILAPILALIIGFGIYPKPLLSPIDTSAQTIFQTMQSKILKHSSETTDNMIESEYYEHIPNDFDDEGIRLIPNIGD